MRNCEPYTEVSKEVLNLDYHLQQGTAPFIVVFFDKSAPLTLRIIIKRRCTAVYVTLKLYKSACVEIKILFLLFYLVNSSQKERYLLE